MKKSFATQCVEIGTNSPARVAIHPILGKPSNRLRTLSLLLWISIAVGTVYLPVLGVRTLRFAGDEKSYLAQVVEMKDRSHWFVQTFAGEPCYYKGPFHYLAVRASALVFG